MSQKQQVLDEIDQEWIAEQAERLVRVPSVTMYEQEVCRLYEQQLRELGLDVEVREITPGRTNLYARLPGVEGGRTLMLNGHLDTIPDQNNQPVYRDGDLLYGRGTTDMKGGMAAILGAVRALVKSGVRLRGDVLITAVVGHEEPEAAKDGVLAMVDDINSGRLTCDRIVIVEGPDALWVMSMGSMVFHITLESPLGGQHTQYVPFGDNPIRYLGLLIDRIHEYQVELDVGPLHGLAGAQRIDLGIVRSGDYFNRTPHVCSLTGTRRWMPGQTAATVLDELTRLAMPIAEAGGLQLQVSMEHEREPFETSADDPITKAVAASHMHVTGTEAELVGKRIVGDANIYFHGTGVPTIYYGPSNETAHADIENVSIRRMESAAKVYALTAMNFCEVGRS